MNDRSRPVPPRRSALQGLVPRPWTAAGLFASWLLLNQTLAPGHLLLGTLLALVLARIGVRDPQPSRTAASRLAPGRRALVAARLLGRVLRDIVVANLQVTVRILGPLERLQPGFVWVPLALTDPRAITLLAGIVTMTPGTVSADVSDDRRHLLVHGLDIDDPAGLVAEIKSRYETPIREMFE